METLRACINCKYAMPLECNCNSKKCFVENANKVECIFPLLYHERTSKKLKTDCCINHKVK